MNLERLDSLSVWVIDLDIPAYLDVEYLQGIHVTNSVLWLDAVRENDLSFWSHALSDPILPHHKILLTKTTAALMRKGKRKAKTLICPYHRRFTLGDLDIELFPSGYMPGSAQVRLTRENNRLVYTGPFRLDGLGHDDIPILECDTLVIWAEYADARDQPDDFTHAESIIQWARQNLSSGTIPIFFTDTIGPTVRLTQLLTLAEIPIKMHVSMYRIIRKIDEIKSAHPKIRRFNPRTKDMDAIVLPLSARDTKSLTRLKRFAGAVVHTTTLNHNQPHSTPPPDFNAEVRFFLPMHATYRHQMQYVRCSKARKIQVAGPASDAFASELRAMGFNAWPLRPPIQLSLLAPLTTRSIPSQSL